ncbi:MAG: hypothetical protein PHH09_13015 [Methanoregulaceae archaeon]|jgi:hypothetical protein|nr:hypothetical protein [Methanoregulaceae archaeon]
MTLSRGYEDEEHRQALRRLADIELKAATLERDGFHIQARAERQRVGMLRILLEVD